MVLTLLHMAQNVDGIYFTTSDNISKNSGRTSRTRRNTGAGLDAHPRRHQNTCRRNGIFVRDCFGMLIGRRLLRSEKVLRVFES
jgi:hypothetical protein